MTNNENPKVYPRSMFLSRDYHLKEGLLDPKRIVIRTPPIHISTVLLTSTMARAKELILLAMMTVVEQKIAWNMVTSTNPRKIIEFYDSSLK